jgi:TRAP-type C4-dicarboxylate transport system substrate-binding protein
MGPARLIAQVVVACAVLFAAADTALGLEKKIIRISHAGAADTAASEHQLYATLFADYINAKSQTLEVRIFANSGLGQSRQVIEGMAMQLGSSASMHIGGMAEFASFCETKCGVVGLPFVFRSFDHVARVMDGPVGAALAAELEKSGLKVISYLNSWGYRNVATASKRIDALADLKGLTIRTIPTPVFVGAINAMGAAATPMDFGQIDPAMQAGVLNGFEHTAATVLSFKFYGIGSIPRW